MELDPEGTSTSECIPMTIINVLGALHAAETGISRTSVGHVSPKINQNKYEGQCTD